MNLFVCLECKEYGKYVYSIERDPVLLIGAGNVEKNECGMTETPLIVGGEDAKEKEFPHMVIFFYSKERNVTELGFRHS